MGFQLGGFSLGFDDMSGDDDDDMGSDDLDGDDLDLGADAPARRRSRGGRGAIQKVQDVQAQRKLNALRKRHALQQRSIGALQPSEQTQYLPFPKAEGGGAAVPAATINTVAARPQRPFQTQRFVWPSTTSSFFVITQFTIGVDNMFVQAGEAAAEVFAQTGVGVSLEGYIALPGIDITLQVLNEDTAPHAIRAGIVGASLVNA